MSQTLYIRFSPHHLSFARYEAGRDGALSYAPWKLRHRGGLLSTLREACEALPLTAGATRTEVILSTQTVVVPLADFDEADCEQVYDFCMTTDLPHRVFYDTLPAANAVLVYGMSEIVCRAFDEAFDNVHYTSTQMHSMRRLTAYDYRPGGCKRVFTYLHDHSADIVVFDGSRILFSNTFEVAETQDVVYFAFNVADKLSINREQDFFYLLGPEFLRKPTATAFRQYARNVTEVLPQDVCKTTLAETETEVPIDLLLAAAH